MACFGAPAGDTWAARGEHHEHPARSGPSGKRKPMFSEVGKGTGRLQIGARARAMMLMMLTQRWLPRTRARNDAGHDRRKDQRTGGGGGGRAPPPSLPPAQ